MELEDIVEEITNEVYEKIASEIKENEDISGDLSGGANSGAANSQASAVHSDVASYIDHTMLSPDATEEDIKQLCKEARQYNFASVCVNPGNVMIAADFLRGSNVTVCSVIGFPLGATTTKTKVAEAKEAMENGAREIDMVMNIGALKSGNFDKVKNDIEEVVIAAKGRALVKVIIETCLLTEEEKVKACSLAKVAEADFVKTSTGFSSGGATVEDVGLMRETVGPDMGVKASGGVRDYEKAMAMINAGATRIGASGSVKIVKGEKASSDY